jgi:hypothetical protein
LLAFVVSGVPAGVETWLIDSRRSTMPSSSGVNDQLPDLRERNWFLQSMMEMQKTQGQLVEAVDSLREGEKDLRAEFGTVVQQVGSLGQDVRSLGRKSAPCGRTSAP